MGRGLRVEEYPEYRCSEHQSEQPPPRADQTAFLKLLVLMPQPRMLRRGEEAAARPRVHGRRQHCMGCRLLMGWVKKD